MIDRLARRLGRVDTRDLVAIGTLLVLFANTPRTPDALPLLFVLFFAMVAPLPIAVRFRRSALPWLALALGWMPFLVEGWWRHEDHEFLGLEHCAALALVLTASRPRAALHLYARAMIVAIFACALAWKLSAPSFVSGDTFAWALEHDARFIALAAPLGEASTRPLAIFMTLWTVATEGTLLVSFAAPDRSAMARLREPALVTFVASVYTLIPILGYGGLFLVLGLATTRSPRWRLAIVALAAWLALRLAIGLAL